MGAGVAPGRGQRRQGTGDGRGRWHSRSAAAPASGHLAALSPVNQVFRTASGMFLENSVMKK